jgi:hypothetical protein
MLLDSETTVMLVVTFVLTILSIITLVKTDMR